MTRRHRVLAAAAALGALAAAAPALGAGTTVTVADKGFAESRIVADLYAQALQAQGFTVIRRGFPSSRAADAALRSGAADMYPEYTGTAWLTLLGGRPTAGRARVFRLVRDAEARRGLVALPPSPFSNDNQVACTRAALRAGRVSTLSGLAAYAPRLTYAANPEHLTRADGLPVLARDYGIRFRRVVTTSIAGRYRPVQAGRAQCVYAFSTDPEVARLGLVPLRDDRGVFARTPYQGFPVVRRAYLDTAPPAFAETVNRVSALLDRATVTRLDAQVTIDGRQPGQVAGDLLRERGLLPG